MKKATLFLLTFITTLVLVACGNRYTYVEGKVNIVATTTMLGNLAKEIGGEDVSITTLMGVGVDPHLYAPKASDTNALRRSDFIIFNGLDLEGKMTSVLVNLSNSKAHVNAGIELQNGNGTLITQDDEYPYDPHIWFDVENWIVVAKGLGRELAAFDPDNATAYQTRTNTYVTQLEDLHQWILNRTDELTQAQRVLVTAHDAFAYFANAYDFEVEAIQGISTESEASIADINNLVEIVIAKNVKSIFIESSVPRRTIDAVINAARDRGHILTVGGELYSDSLGDGDHSNYINAVKHNVNTIVDNLK